MVLDPRRSPQFVILVFGLLASTACGEDDDGWSSGGAGGTGGTSSGVGGGAGGNGMSCASEQMRVWGQLNGEAIDLQGAVTGHMISLGATTVQGDGFDLYLESAGNWVSGGTEPARGSVTDLNVGGLDDIGNCGDDPFTGSRTVDEDGDGAHFTLSQFTEGPVTTDGYPLGDFCGSTPVEGELTGCFRW